MSDKAQTGWDVLDEARTALAGVVAGVVVAGAGVVGVPTLSEWVLGLLALLLVGLAVRQGLPKIFPSEYP